jgi:predicted Zn-dependent protease
MNTENKLKSKLPVRFKLILFFSISLVFILGALYLHSRNTSISYQEMHSLAKQTQEAGNILLSGKATSVIMRGYADTLFKYGRVALGMQEYDLAVLFYEQGLSFNPWNKFRILELAYAYQKKGDYQQAYQRIMNVLETKPSPFIWMIAQWRRTQLRDLYQPQENKEGFTPLEHKLKAATIYLLPFGFDNENLMQDLRLLAQDALKIKFEVLPPLKGDIPGYDVRRKQYFAAPLADFVRSARTDYLYRPDTLGILVVTDFDITAENLNFLFGWVDPAMEIGVISFNRFIRDKPDDKILFQRIYTQLLSTAGFILGIPRCSLAGCARSYPHSFAEFKNKSYLLCSQCQGNLNKRLQELSNYPDVEYQEQDKSRLEKIKVKYGI